MELCTKGLGGSVPQLKSRGVNLSCVRTCVVVAEERPRISLCDAFTKLFSGLSLSPRAVSTSFGCRVNVAICLQVSLVCLLGLEYSNRVPFETDHDVVLEMKYTSAAEG